MEILIILAGYLIGSIPFGLLIARWFGRVDIRTVGSGNIGATNVGRVMGMQWFGVVFVLDALKGLLPTLGAKLLLGEDTTAFWAHHGATLTGAATILGHMFPCYLKFKGGKGVATALGVVFVLAPIASAVAAGIFAVSTALWRMISLSSILAAVTFGILELCLLKPHPLTSENLTLAFFSVIIPALIIYRHRSNIGRLIRGEENKIGQKVDKTKPKPPER